MRNYFYNEELGILILRVEGEIEVTDIMDHYNKLSSYSTNTENLKVLIDCSNVKFQIKPKEINQSLVSLANALKAYISIREAIMVSKPYATVVATLFQALGERFDHYAFQLFYTKKAATDWLLEGYNA